MRTLALVAMTMLLAASGGCVETRPLSPDDAAPRPAAAAATRPDTATATPPAQAPAPAAREPLPLLNH